MMNQYPPGSGWAAHPLFPRREKPGARLDFMYQGRCLGLVGGLGVGAAIHYYKILAEAHEKQGVSLDLVMAHAEAARVFAYVQAEDREGLANYLTGFLRRLQAAGAELAVVPAESGETP
jgi:aspartate/glutamate racemase